MHTKSIKLESHTLLPTGKIDRQLALKLYRSMLLTYEFEDRLIKLYKQGDLFGGLFTGCGNEAVSVGASTVLKQGDWIAPSHRCIGAHFVRGESLNEMMLQLMARAEGQTKGRDNSAHQGSTERGVISLISHLATSPMLAAGCALAMKQKKRKNVAIAFIGEGSTSLGGFHEVLNFASVLKLPFVLIIENNQYAYSTPTANQYSCEKLSDRSVGYGIPGVTIDGTDVELVYRTVNAAIERARAGFGPSLIETITCRLHGHSAHDGAEYVPKDVKEKWLKRHPVSLYRKTLTKRRWLNKKTDNQIIAMIRSDIENAIQFAKSKSYPPAEDAAIGVYAE